MARLNLQNQPTAYPKGIFYTLRICQLLASTVVAGEMFYFIYWLAHGGYKIPWMFFFLHGAALLTLITLIITSIVHWRHQLSALANGAINLVTTGLWIAGFGLLASAMRETILDACVPELWGDSNGIRICHLYKLLFAASLLGMLSTIGALTVDVIVYMRVRPSSTRYIKANPLLEKEDMPTSTRYSNAPYEDLYDPYPRAGQRGRGASPSVPRAEASTLAVQGEDYPHGRRSASVGA